MTGTVCCDITIKQRMSKSAHKTTDLENAAFFPVPGFTYSRQTLQGFILFNTLTVYGELKDIYVQYTIFPPTSRNLDAMKQLCNGPAVLLCMWGSRSWRIGVKRP
jgi:hypothetical protein